MSKLSTFILVACMAGAGVMKAQVTKTVHVAEAGTLSTLLTEEEKTTVTDLTVTGNIDRADIYFMGSLVKGAVQTDFLPRNTTGVLVNIDFSEAVVSGDSIPEGAFEERGNLGKVTVPNSIKVIGKKAFYQLVYNTGADPFDFQYPTGLKEICSQAFADVSDFANFDLPEGLETIGSNAFYHTDGFGRQDVVLTIPSTVISIGAQAFLQCLHIKKVYNYVQVPLNIETYESPTWGTTMYSHVFSDETLAAATLYVPKASIDAYKAVAVWKDFSAIEAIEDATALPTVKTTEAVYGYIANNALTVTGLTGTAVLTLTDLNGTTLLRKTVSSGVSIPLNGLSKGVYVVKIGNKTNKVIKK